MKPLILLIVVFAAFTSISRLTTGNWNLQFAGNLAMLIMLCFTALGHILFPKGMSLMIPPLFPFKKALGYLTGLAEVILGLALLSPSTRPYAGYGLIVFFILIVPANIYAAIHHLDIEKGTYTGPGPGYLWFRIPMQLFLIGWVYYFSMR